MLADNSDFPDLASDIDDAINTPFSRIDDNEHIATNDMQNSTSSTINIE